jgi:HSP20 family protein
MLMRFDPFRDLDRLTQQLWNTTGNGQGGLRAMPMDAYRRGDRFIVHFDLPGVDPDAIELTIEKNVLTVSAERRWERQEGDEAVAAERLQGSFTRQLFLGETLDPDHVEARYEQGVLTLTIPVAEAAKPRRVTVAAGDSRAASIEAASQPHEADAS